MKNEELYWKIDEEEELSDEEKRETYFAELANQEAKEEWEDSFN